MKKGLLLTVMTSTIILVLSSCIFSVNGLNLIKPSSTIIEKEFSQKPFNKLIIQVVGNIKIVQTSDSDSRVVFSVPDNYLDLFALDNNGEELKIKFKKNNTNIFDEKVHITVYTPNINSIVNSGASKTGLDSLVTDKLEIVNSGVGSFSLNNLKADQVNVKCSGVGSIELTGETNTVRLKCSGVGSINASQLIAKSAEVKLSGTGSIKCYSTEEIEGSVSGVGSLQYGGHPKEKDLHSSGVGSISEF